MCALRLQAYKKRDHHVDLLPDTLDKAGSESAGHADLGSV